jgi:hypothetical protein
LQGLQQIDRSAQLTGVCLIPLQDRDHTGRRTPRWRGITALQELAGAGVAVALASDNTRDQFYAYGDLDMLEVFAQVGLCNAAAVNTR